MKSLIILAIALSSSVSFARITVQHCHVSSIKLEVQAFANQYMVRESSAFMASRMNGKVIVNTNEAKFVYVQGEEAMTLVKNTPAVNLLVKKLKASDQNIRNGFSLYTYGNMEDDAAGVVYIVFNAVRAQSVQGVFHGWAGPHKCDE